MAGAERSGEPHGPGRRADSARARRRQGRRAESPGKRPQPPGKRAGAPYAPPDGGARGTQDPRPDGAASAEQATSLDGVGRPPEGARPDGGGHLQGSEPRRSGRSAAAAYFRANPQVFVLLVICLVLGLGTFLAVLIALATAGGGQTTGEPSGMIPGVHAVTALTTAVRSLAL
jgi:hypothetical protein